MAQNDPHAQLVDKLYYSIVFLLSAYFMAIVLSDINFFKFERKEEMLIIKLCQCPDNNSHWIDYSLRTLLQVFPFTSSPDGSSAEVLHHLNEMRPVPKNPLIMFLCQNREHMLNIY